MELKYPVKYAIMPIKEQCGFSHGMHELEAEYKVVANIVVKCYLIGKTKSYSSDGTIENDYEVVFLYKRKQEGFERVIPEYSIYNQCTNSNFVNKLFSNYEDAVEAAEKLNDEILRRSTRGLSQDEREEATSEHYYKINRYKMLEKSFEDDTIDVEITADYDEILEGILKRVVDKTSDFYIKLANALSSEEKEYFKELVANRSCGNCIKDECELRKIDGVNCSLWDNPELIGKQLILKDF